jgi:hypothetical protein
VIRRKMERIGKILERSSSQTNIPVPKISPDLSDFDGFKEAIAEILSNVQS